MAPVPPKTMQWKATMTILATMLLLGGCVAESNFDKLSSVKPTGSPFSQALFKDYAYLARSFGSTAANSGTPFDTGSTVSLDSFDNATTQLANDFAGKALVAGRGEEVIIDPVPEDDTVGQAVRLRVLKDIDAGREKVPADAARAQAEFDCWVMNARVASQRNASLQCRRQLDRTLARLESEIAPPPTQAPPAPAPTTPVQSAPAPAPVAQPGPESQPPATPGPVR